MSSVYDANGRNLRLLSQVLHDAWDDDPGPAVPWSLLEGIERLVPCDMAVSYQENDLRERHLALVQEVCSGTRLIEDPCEPDEDDDLFYDLFWISPLCSYPQRTGDLTSVIQSTDFHPTLASLRRDRLWAEFLLDTGARHSMIVSMPAAPGRMRRILFKRSTDQPFSERERQIVSLLRPHVYELVMRSQLWRRADVRLSPREWEVLRLVATGRSNSEIAAVLVVSVATVRKHVEHIRERLGVHTRAAAVAAAMPSGVGATTPS